MAVLAGEFTGVFLPNCFLHVVQWETTEGWVTRRGKGNTSYANGGKPPEVSQ